MTPAQWRSAGLHVVSVGGGAVAAISFMASHAVDLYAIYDQFNVVFREGSKLAAMVLPIASGAYAVYKASTRNKIADVVKAPDAIEAARSMLPTRTLLAVAENLKVDPRDPKI